MPRPALAANMPTIDRKALRLAARMEDESMNSRLRALAPWALLNLLALASALLVVWPAPVADPLWVVALFAGRTA